MNIQLHIERLVLDGIALSPGQQRQFQAELEAELGRMLADGAMIPEFHSGRSLARLRAPDITLTPRADPGALGTQVAQSVVGGLRS